MHHIPISVNKMAQRPKRTLRQPIRFDDEYSAPLPKQSKEPTKDNNLYEIELKEVDQERNLVRIHYKFPILHISHLLDLK